MYCISRHANLTLPIRASKPIYNAANGAVERVIPALVVQFQHSGTVPDYAKEAVTRLVDWGQGVGLDEDPFERCGSFDSDVEAVRNNWTDEDKAIVEETLRSGAGTLYVVADAPRAAKPWPRYDEITGDDAAKQIAWQVEQLGLDPGAVVRYEHENLKREDVLAAVQALVPSDEDVAAVISA